MPRLVGSCCEAGNYTTARSSFQTRDDANSTSLGPEHTHTVNARADTVAGSSLTDGTGRNLALRRLFPLLARGPAEGSSCRGAEPIDDRIVAAGALAPTSESG
ncbi:hypothetical protein [Dactylosporangium sp. CA-139066]|uniref:hypothetical protein n=1 Tax=Dactylosporangium sp. CA-139066 TaxID=3239930 RepID=UPI003D923B5A